MDGNSQDDMLLPPFEEPTVYELRVDGRLGHESAAWFEDLMLEVDGAVSPPQTIIRGVIRDQAALYGVIGRLRDLGLNLLSVRRLDSQDS